MALKGTAVCELKSPLLTSVGRYYDSLAFPSAYSEVIMWLKTCLCVGLVALLSTLVACGGGSSSLPGPPPGPPVTAITLRGLTPSAVVAGDPGFNLVLTGSGFLPGAKAISMARYETALSLAVVS